MGWATNMIRVLLGSAAFSVLVACQTTRVPDSGFDADKARRDAALAQTSFQPPLQATVPSAPSVSQTALPSNPAAAPLPSSITSAVQGTDPLEAAAAARAAAANSGVQPVQANPANPAPGIAQSGGISSEQDFGEVSSRRSIQNDAARIAANRAQYTVIAPTALPTRSGSGSQPNIVAYALSTNHPVGTQLHRRSRIRSNQRQAAACAAFPSPDQAQIEFLSQGGPDRDRKGLDPDGDGFACTWDPTPFRAARRRAVTPTQPVVTPSAAQSAAVSVQPEPSVATPIRTTPVNPTPTPQSPSSIVQPLAISNE